MLGDCSYAKIRLPSSGHPSSGHPSSGHRQAILRPAKGSTQNELISAMGTQLKHSTTLSRKLARWQVQMYRCYGCTSQTSFNRIVERGAPDQRYHQVHSEERWRADKGKQLVQECKASLVKATVGRRRLVGCCTYLRIASCVAVSVPATSPAGSVPSHAYQWMFGVLVEWRTSRPCLWGS
jgi:hypothetical protein